jgi:hypothetical protein
LHHDNQFDTFLIHLTGISKSNCPAGMVTQAAVNAAFIVVSSSMSIFKFAFHAMFDKVNFQSFTLCHDTTIHKSTDDVELLANLANKSPVFQSQSRKHIL